MNKKKNLNYFGHFSLNIFAYSSSLFIFAKINFNHYMHINKYIKAISNYTFGIYLIHPLILEKIFQINFFALSNKISFKIPIISLLLFVLSLLICFFIKFLPIIGKYFI